MKNQATLHFILEHDNEDTSKLLFGAGKYPQVDMPLAVRSIEARKKVKSKIPLWYPFPELEYPAMINVEQCSSQATALYKQLFLKGSAADSEKTACTIADLTGGLGVDSYFFSLVAKEVDYIEQNGTLAEAAKGNFELLGCSNINVSSADSEVFLQESTKHYDLIYIDPARRGNIGQRVYSITDCQPNVVAMEPLLFAHSNKILIKASPMADIHHTLSLFPRASQVHIVSVENECKEVLILLEKGFEGEAKIFAVNIKNSSAAAGKDLECETLCFTLTDEANASASLTSAPKTYIYQPNKSLLKGGCFKLICNRYGVEKLAPSTHLYTSEKVIKDFPGRRYKVLEVMPFNKQSIKELAARYPNAEAESLNFPISTNTLKEKLKIKGSSDRIKHFACTLTDSRKVILTVTRD